MREKNCAAICVRRLLDNRMDGLEIMILEFESRISELEDEIVDLKERIHDLEYLAKNH